MTVPDEKERNPDSEPGMEAYIGLGSNMGERISYLREAVRALEAVPDTELTCVSDVYETEPVGYADQDSFLNMVVVVRTRLSPASLHGHMKQIEERLGRVRTIRNGPRTIDLDLLLMDDVALDTPELTVPHPRMWERAFVLIPLADVVRNQSQLLATTHEHLDRLDGKEGVTRWSNFNWRDESERSAN
ncbi:2-amino-4-hydroxy-6-hydroxymethyldihydropteridine diphosphokinase [Paenibacillus ginsengarvi]|nr:2-amino-4-hydroxy-6-hydroxymethyldihydropteridine diphosphokinase [Paenibacillus ginsengarvi]